PSAARLSNFYRSTDERNAAADVRHRENLREGSVPRSPWRAADVHAGRATAARSSDHTAVAARERALVRSDSGHHGKRKTRRQDAVPGGSLAGGRFPA